VDPFHEHLARVGLAAAGRYGLALAGGYAMQAHGLLERASEDVDLFMAWHQRSEFGAAVDAVVAAYMADELTVRAETRWDTFARLHVSDGVETTKVELSADWRANDPTWMTIGPVLHPDDAVANKMCALFGRGEVRDFVDVDAALRSGRYSREGLVALAAAADRGFDRSMFADILGSVSRLADGAFAAYGVSGRELDEMRERFAQWRRELVSTGDRPVG
jgi:hypothetical protein